jgi:hypothetical protein
MFNKRIIECYILKKHIVFLVPAILLSAALVSGQSAYSTVQSLPGVGPSGEDPYQEDTTWTYNSPTGTLCATTPDGEVSCTQYEAGIPCEDFEAPEFVGQLECND